MADRHGQKATAQKLLGERANIQAISDDNQAPLLLAAEEGHKEVIELLLDEGADVNAQGGVYGNALQAALSGGHEQIVKLLLDKNADVSVQDETFSNCTEEMSCSYSVSETYICEDLLLSGEAFCSGCIALVRECSKVLSQNKQIRYDFITISIGQKVIEESASEGCGICRKFVISMAKQKARVWGPLLSSDTAHLSLRNLNTTYTLWDNKDGSHDLCLTYEWISQNSRLYPRLTFYQIDSMFNLLQLSI